MSHTLHVAAVWCRCPDGMFFSYPSVASDGLRDSYFPAQTLCRSLGMPGLGAFMTFTAASALRSSALNSSGYLAGPPVCTGKCTAHMPACITDGLMQKPAGE